MRPLYLLLLVMGTGACIRTELPATQALYDISTDGSTLAKRAFDPCVLRYAFRNKARTINVGSLHAQLKLACFDAWASANGYLEFVPVAPNEPAEINLVFADTLPPGPQNYTPFGLVGQPIPVLSRLVRHSDNSSTIYLLNTHAWTELTLRRVLLHQIGAALGLATSTRSESVMSAQLSTLTQFDTSDINAIRRVYDQPCDAWTKLTALPFDGRFVETSAATTQRGYVVMDGDNNLNALWEFNPESATWQRRTPCPVSQADAYGFTPQRLAIAVDSILLVGNSFDRQWTPGRKGVFMRYRAATNATGDDWFRIDSLPQLGYHSGHGFSVGGKGFVVTMDLTTTRAERISVSQYDPAANRWSKPPAFERRPQGFYELENSLTFVLDQQAFFIVPEPFWGQSWRMAPFQAPLWTEVAPFVANYNTNLGFAVRNAGYGMSGSPDPKVVWQYKVGRGWKRMKDCPATGRLIFSFVVGNRAYVGTYTGEFWMYRP